MGDVFGKQKDYWNDREHIRRWRAVHLAQIYSDRMAGKRKGGVLMMYPVYAAMLSFTADFRRSLIYNEQTLMRILNVEYEENYSPIQGTDEQVCSGKATIRETS